MQKIYAFPFRYPLKVVVEGMYDVKLYPEDGETTTILNIKRGIISALAVPLLEGDKNKLMVHKRENWHVSALPSSWMSLYVHHTFTLAHNPWQVQDFPDCQQQREHRYWYHPQQRSIEMWQICPHERSHQPPGPHLWHGEIIFFVSKDC